MPRKIHGVQRCPSEWGFTSRQVYRDEFNDIELDVVFVGPDGREWRMPAFWAGRQEWRVRFAPPVPGEYQFRTVCSNPHDADLHDQRGVLRAASYAGNHPLLRHGPLRVNAGKRYLEHEDGTPFFWLADTWWYALHARLRWPDDFQTLAHDRKAKGFTTIQLVAGIFPELDPFDPRCANEAGLAWEPAYARINPAYFDMADLRVQWLVRVGLVPCIVGMWGYHVLFLGEEKVKKHWRNLLARYAAYPVVWCLAGEGTMGYYLLSPEERRANGAVQRKVLTEIGRYLRSTDPCHHPVTVHPPNSGRDCVDDDTVLDFNMLQTGHNDWLSVPKTVETMVREYQHEPIMPVINGEVAYEGHQDRNWANVQRFMFWTCMLSGAAGHTYGASGIWQANALREPLGASVSHPPYEDTPWEVAAQFPGAAQLGISKALLMRYPWWRIEPHPEWAEPRWSDKDYGQLYAAGISGELRIIYRPLRLYGWNGPLLKHVEPGTTYRAFYFNPITGVETPLGTVQGDAQSQWQAPKVPLAQDWVLVMERA